MHEESPGLSAGVSSTLLTSAHAVVPASTHAVASFICNPTFALPPMLPLRVDPSIRLYAQAIEVRAQREPAEAHRLRQMAFLFRCHEVKATRYITDDAGRIYLHDSPLQGIPKSVRHCLRAPEGCTFVSADWRSAHLVIASRWTGDTLLMSHDTMAHVLGVDRAVAKVATLAFINGGGEGRLRDITGRKDSYRALENLLPGVVAFKTRMQELHRSTPETIYLPSLAGILRPVQRPMHDGGWRRLLSGMWTRTEADAMAWVLRNLPERSRLAVPLFDGLLIACRSEESSGVASALASCMRQGAMVAGVDLDVKIGVGQSWGAAEGLVYAPPARAEDARSVGRVATWQQSDDVRGMPLGEGGYSVGGGDARGFAA